MSKENSSGGSGPLVELVSFPGCPNRDAALDLLQERLQARGLDIPVRQVNSDAAENRARYGRYASPTILVDGEDVSEGADSTGTGACRLYEGGRKVPPVRDIDRALEDMKQKLRS